MKERLKPVKNFRSLFHRRCCSQCRHWNAVYSETVSDYHGSGPMHSGYACDRVNGPEGDWNACEPEFYVCDRFAWRDTS